MTHLDIIRTADVDRDEMSFVAAEKGAILPNPRARIAESSLWGRGPKVGGGAPSRLRRAGRRTKSSED